MHDVNVLKPKILAWINSIVQFFNPYLQVPQKGKEFYNFFKSGLPMFYIFYLYLTDETVRPKPELFLEFAQNRAEFLSNLNYVVQIQYKFNLPIYLTPQDYLDQFEPNFLMLQLYYLYCKFKHVKAQSEQSPNILFKDHDRKLEESEILSPQLTMTDDDAEAIVSPHEANMMEIIKEVDSSIELNSSIVRSKRTSVQNDTFQHHKQSVD